jgi:hypothetical protein
VFAMSGCGAARRYLESRVWGVKSNSYITAKADGPLWGNLPHSLVAGVGAGQRQKAAINGEPSGVTKLVIKPAVGRGQFAARKRYRRNVSLKSGTTSSNPSSSS